MMTHCAMHTDCLYLQNLLLTVLKRGDSPQQLACYKFSVSYAAYDRYNKFCNPPAVSMINHSAIHRCNVVAEALWVCLDNEITCNYPMKARSIDMCTSQYSTNTAA